MIRPARMHCFHRDSGSFCPLPGAVAAKPSILLLDEITANLDVGTEQEVLYALRRAGENRTVVSISHRLYEKMGGRELVIG